MELITLGLWVLCLGIAVARIVTAWRYEHLMERPFPGCLFLLAVPISLISIGFFCNFVANHRVEPGGSDRIVLFILQILMTLISISTLISWLASRAGRYDYGHKYSFWLAFNIIVTLLFIIGIYLYRL